MTVTRERSTSMSSPARPDRPAFGLRRSTTRGRLLIGSALLSAFGVLVATAGPVAACSCAMADSLKEYATAENAIFVGTAGLRQDRGVPVEIDQWLWGQGGAPVVWLADASFGDGASCGTEPPPTESAWIWVTWRDPESGDFATGLCSPAGRLDTVEGQAMLEEALAVFGGLSPPELAPESTEAAPRRTASPEPDDPTISARDTTGLLVGAGVIGASLLLFGGIAVLARRQGTGPA
jgi:hypothetical protein